MIEFDYLLERNENDETRVYTPDKIKSPLPNIVYIEGPNSSGKSAFLHIVALSMYGLKNESINQSLINKMRPLVESDYQRLKFDLCITNNDGSLKLISTKNDLDRNEIEVREIKNGHKRILGPDLFRQEYELIYDIPDNPTERLTQLSKEISEIQKEYGHNVSMLSSYILDTIREIKSGFDPEKLTSLEKQLDQLDRKIREEKERNEKNNACLDITEKYTFTKYLLYYTEMVDNSRIKLKKIKPTEKNPLHRRNTSDNRLSALEQTAQKKVKELNDLYIRISLLLKTILPKEELNHFDIWERISISNSLVDLEFDGNLIKEIDYFLKILARIADNDDKKAFTEAELYNSLIEFLENYKNTMVVIPGVDKNVAEFLLILKEANKKNEKIIAISNNRSETQELLSTLKSNCGIVESTIFEAIKKLKEEQNCGDDIQLLVSNNLNDTLEKELEYYEEKEKYYLKECLKKGIDSDTIVETISLLEREYGHLYNEYTEEQLNKKIKDLQTLTSGTKTSIEKLEQRKTIMSEDIQKLKEKPPHKYQSQLDTLNKLLPLSQKLQQKLLVEYDKYISIVIDNKRNEFEKQQKINPEIVTYFESISKYLANRVESVKYIDKTYELDKVDLLDELLIAKNGKVIRLSDMGTGQSQSAFLLGLLNKSHNKPIIALFDEVAMMDSSSLEPIYRKFNELYERGLLLAGVVVQKGEQIKIESKHW